MTANQPLVGKLLSKKKTCSQPHFRGRRGKKATPTAKKGTRSSVSITQNQAAVGPFKNTAAASHHGKKRPSKPGPAFLRGDVSARELHVFGSFDPTSMGSFESVWRAGGQILATSKFNVNFDFGSVSIMAHRDRRWVGTSDFSLCFKFVFRLREEIK